MTKRTILYVINHMDWFWSHRLPLAQEAQKQGWHVCVCAHSAGGDARLAEHSFEGIELASSQGSSPATVLKLIAALRGIIDDRKPDIVHAITLKYAFIAGLAAIGISPKTKMVHTLAGLGYLFSGEGFKPKLLRGIITPLMQLAFKNNRTVAIFQNPDDQALMIKRGFVRGDQTYLIKGSGIDLDAFAFTPEPDNDVPIIVMPTRLVHEKGVSVFVEAARILKAKGVNAKFQIAGGLAPTNPRAISENEMRDMTADGTVEWLGKVSDMPTLLAGSNLVVYPSYYGEGVPKVLLEAAAIGRAIITTDHPGCREAVIDGENGLLVPIKDADATADAVEKLLNDAELRRAMGRASRKIAEEEFDVKIVVKKTTDIYAALLSG